MDQSERKYAQLKDPGIRAFLEAGARFYPDNAVDFTLAEQREFYNRYCAHFRKSRPADITTSDFKVGEVPCRIYVPHGKTEAPIMLYLHGGGNQVGNQPF